MSDSALLRRSRATLLKTLLVLSLHLLFLYFALRAGGVLSRPPSALPTVFLSVLSAAPERPVQAVEKPPAHAKAEPLQVAAAAVTAPTSSAPATSEANLPALTATLAAMPMAAPPSQVATVAETLTDARFDAAYLNNPAPNYPLISRRNGEAGQVLLLVQVTKQGTAAQVELKQSCGFARLDAAALEAVWRWRFVPARRGDEAIAASVLVPLTFRLNS